MQFCRVEIVGAVVKILRKGELLEKEYRAEKSLPGVSY